MAGKFINTDQKVMLDFGTDTVKSLLNNPYYMFSDKKGSVTQYYNINNTKTTLDEATNANYSELGPNSPIRYNKIKDAVLYGISRMDVNLDITDVGLESSDISGEAYILPNTWKPYPGDFFTLDQLGKPYLFRVTDCTPNMLDTGSSMYKINYVYAYPNLHGIEDQVVEEYVMTISNNGTNFNALIKSTVYDTASKLQYYAKKLKDYYYMIFYDQKVQTFIFNHRCCMKVYDPYMIEFIIRNNILGGTDEYVYVSQQMYLPSTFGVDYDKTIFSCIEECDVNSKARIRHVMNLYVCRQQMSLLYAYPEDYYYAEYARLNTNLHCINIFGDELDILYYIRNNIKTSNVLYNIMIEYFNNEDITEDDLKQLKNLDYCDNMELYYGIPIAIFCMEKMISNMIG